MPVPGLAAVRAAAAARTARPGAAISPSPAGGGGKKGGWRPYRFQNLEKVSRSQALLTSRLEWLMPAAGGRVVEGIRNRMKELFEEDVNLLLDYVTVVSPGQLRKFIAEPTFLAILTPAPQKARAFLEIELGLAHAAIDKLLGGAGDSVGHRPLTDIEEGVMSFIILEALKTLAPNMEPGLPKMRLEGVAHGVDEALQLLQDETQVVVVLFKGTMGTQPGAVRLYIPSAIIGMTNPPEGGGERRGRRRHEVERNAGRLGSVKVWLRAEIGKAEIMGRDLAGLRTGDVVVVDELTARPDREEGGTARLRIGAGRRGWIDAEINLELGKFRAKILSFHAGEEPKHAALPSEDPAPEIPDDEGSMVAGRSAEQSEEDLSAVSGEAASLEDEAEEDHSTNPVMGAQGEGNPVSDNAEGVDLLNDIPLQIAVELGRIPVTAEEVVALKTGQVIDLNRMPGEPVEMSVNGKIVARGELVEIEGHLGVRILSLIG